MGGDEYTAKMDQQLPEATILLFRRLAHAKVSSCDSTQAVKLFSLVYKRNNFMPSRRDEFCAKNT